METTDSSLHILGSGSSLTKFDFSSLIGHRVLAINNAIKSYPNADYFITGDYWGWNDIIKPYIDTEALKIFILNLGCGLIDDGPLVRDSKHKYDLTSFDMIIKSHTVEGLGHRWTDFRSNNNSGLCAIQWAYLMGYKKLYLHGFDMKPDRNGFMYYFSRDKIVARKERIKYEQRWKRYKEFFIQLSEEIELISCSGISRLNGIIRHEVFDG